MVLLGFSDRKLVGYLGWQREQLALSPPICKGMRLSIAPPPHVDQLGGAL